MASPYIIIGATGGTGRALAQRLANRGHRLYLIGRDSTRLADLSQTLGASHAVADVTEEDTLTDAVMRADQGNGIAGLAYCVGSINLKPLKATRSADFLAAFNLNLLGAATALRAAEKGLKTAKGSVVLFSTVAVEQGFANHAVVAAAKGAVAGLGRALAAEWAPHVRVNVIAPSLTRTPMAAPLLSSEQMAQGIAAMHPLARLGEADDLAAMAEFLLSADAGWITGQVMGVDGGRGVLRTKG
ncbi:MAG: SDR family NAD(P)-dependent oxidoreductase [Niveispirillum sp.]|uniref:SDR family NAD(P)-dependent oxidoreductase n=1 Tax=Niveispirillum sp. TaxID=1917217 RepID=UPI003BA5FB37